VTDLRRGAAIALLVVLCRSVTALAAAPCPQHYVGGRAPDIIRPSLAREVRELCFREFAVLQAASHAPR
jgi:endonuclease G, mitochondrial